MTCPDCGVELVEREDDEFCGKYYYCPRCGNVWED